ncbi:MAG: hypothetical protein QXR97_05110 [Thermoproteota archaeon]
MNCFSGFKTTTNPENIQEQYRKALDALVDYGYIPLIKKCGLKVFNKVYADNGVEAYIIIVV